uniref:Uncharacterized protein n=1 Tax=Chromera velia CCMP2878 TaxID=1169474 RepID=A0A0G4GS99_9ALVE|mmetsp:Transcript_53144/g.104022  ORF Transcript_53144/g.104022 Transcript_53144/m.104022 type:complete len:220 (-) Transcript_53144:606-1265(-)|eukprot:Cvel_23096.t1-p1 / transcript=Cvel_23096.t1 / gene=Cvel_23096 / organism=Chromera_velia_CCMP2878 / gene_product=hypothetical protein / transcript_product=hypothetical protein / location=Cvel_scaffold2342:18486-21093(+) / protein_length=219 / sequence_SO=supercontig / SO=protein_coding / is_pseudo=false
MLKIFLCGALIGGALPWASANEKNDMEEGGIKFDFGKLFGEGGLDMKGLDLDKLGQLFGGGKEKDKAVDKGVKKPKCECGKEAALVCESIFAGYIFGVENNVFECDQALGDVFAGGTNSTISGDEIVASFNLTDCDALEPTAGDFRASVAFTGGGPGISPVVRIVITDEGLIEVSPGGANDDVFTSLSGQPVTWTFTLKFETENCELEAVGTLSLTDQK